MPGSRSLDEGRIAVRRRVAAGSFFSRRESGKECFVFKNGFKIFIGRRFGFIVVDESNDCCEAMGSKG